MENDYIIHNCNNNDINDLFIKLKNILTLERLYEKLSIIREFTNNTDYECHNIIFIKQEKKTMAI